MIAIKILYILLAIFIFGILILIHEGGHYFFARIFKVKINEFAIGMGPRLISHTSKKTGIAYSLRLFPIGGFVSMAGEDEDSEDENALCNKPAWQNIIITAAGAAVNIFAGVLVMFILVLSSKEPIGSNVVYGYNDDTAISSEYGIQAGDRILEVDGANVHIAEDLYYEVMRRCVEPVDITVERDGERIVLSDVHFPTIVQGGATFGNVDFVLYAEESTVPNLLKHAWFRSTNTVKMIWQSLFDLVTGRYGMDAVSGPVGVTEALGEAAKQSFGDLAYLAVIISMNLGIMNLLPLPALDGGRLVFQVIRLIRGKPVKPEIEGYVHFAGFVALIILMIVITFNDVMKLF